MVLFSYVILYVEEVPKALAFYQKAFELEQKMLFPDHSYGELISGATTLAFASKGLAASNLTDGFLPSTLSEKPFGIELGFTTEDVDKVVQMAQEAGATLIEPPKQKEWGQTVAYVRDLDGFLIEICTPMG